MVARALIDRHARVAVLDHSLEQALQIGGERQASNLCPRHHDFTYQRLVKIEDAADHLLLLFAEHAALAKARDNKLDLLGRVLRAERLPGGLAERSEDEVRDPIERPHRIAPELQKQQHRPCHQKRDAVGALVGDGFGHQLPENHEQRRDEGERHRHCNRVRNHERGEVFEAPLDRVLDGLCHNGLALPAHQQADQRHPELRAGNQQPGVGQERLHQARALAALLGQLLDARPPHAQERVFCSGEKRVQENQAENRQRA